MTLAKIAYYLVDMGSVTTAIAFVLLVAHTSLLAFGRRAVIGLAPATAGAGAGASGGTTTVTVDRSSDSNGAETAAGNTGQLFVWLSFVFIGVGMLVRAYLVGRGPWGNLYEFSVAFAIGMPGRLSLPVAALPHPRDRLHPGRRRALPARLRLDAAAGDRPAGAGAGQPAADHAPRGDGDAQLRHLRGQLRGGDRLPDPGQGQSRRRGYRRRRCSTRSPTAR